jgi:AcrR family transcriptional regulator
MPLSKTSGGEATHRALVEASYRLFVTRGYHATTLRDIATEAGITAGSIYNHFCDKEQLIKEVLFLYHPIVRVLPLLSEASGQSTEDLIRDAGYRIVREIEASPGILKLMAIEMIELGGKHFPELFQTISPQIEHFTERIYLSGKISNPTDPTIFFRAFFGMLLGYGVSYLDINTLPGVGIPNPVLDEFINTFLHGVIAPSSETLTQSDYTLH